MVMTGYPIGVPYDDIPRDVRDQLDVLYTRAGVETWWNSTNVSLGNESPRNRWLNRPDDVRLIVSMLSEGAYF